MTSLVAGVSGTSPYRKSTDVSSHESLSFDSLKDKFETLNKWVIKLGDNMSQIAEINQKLGKFNTQAQIFTNSMKVVRTCHVYNSDNSVNKNFKIARDSTVRATSGNVEEQRVKSQTKATNNRGRKSSSTNKIVRNNKSGYRSIRKVIHLLPQMYKSREQIEKLDLILRFLHMKDQPCSLADIHRSLGVSLIMCRKYLDVLLKVRRVNRKKDRTRGLVYFIAKGPVVRRK